MHTISSIDDWLLRNRDASQRPSVRIGAMLDQINACNALTRTYTVIFDGPARARALQLNGFCAADGGPQSLPLLGVPVAVKDNIDIKGTATSCGSIALRLPAALADAAIVRQLELAGAVVLGKSNLDEAALGASGRNDHFGRCQNPTAVDTMSGGSSSGSAAAVAAGHALLAIGTDTLGSVRIPAALCGISGYKPSFARIETGGVAPLYPSFDTVGLLAAGIEDLLYAASVLHPAPLDEAAPDEAATIWVLGESHLAVADPNIAAAYRRRVHALRACDWLRLRELPAFEFAAISRAALWEVAHSFAARIGFSNAAFDSQRRLLGTDLQKILSRAANLPADKLEAGRRTLRTARTDLLRYVAEADAVLTPTCPIASLPAAAALPKAIAAFVAAANVAGLPAVCWPQTLHGMPSLSWQLIGRPDQDLRLLRLAAKIATLA